MATTARLGKKSTIDDFVSGGDAVLIKYSSLSLNEMMGDNSIEFPIFNVYDDYIEELKSISSVVELSKDEWMKYYQAPKLLADYLYKNSELDFIIMRLNGIYDPKDFTSKTIRLVNAKELNTFLSKVYNSNKQFIQTYNQDNPVD